MSEFNVFCMLSFVLMCLRLIFMHVCFRLRTLLKTAKKKLRDQDTGGAEFSSPMSSLRMDLGRHGHAESAIGRMKEKVILSL